MKRLWQGQHFDHEGEYYRVSDGYLNSKPVEERYPEIISAGVSEAGRDFLSDYVGFIVITLDSIEPVAVTGKMNAPVLMGLGKNSAC